MQIRDPNYQARVTDIFERATFISETLGATFEGCGPGWARASMALHRGHRQQDGFTHAGVQASLADHTAGAAAGTLMAAHERVLSVEFKINMLRPSQGERLECEARVIKAGRTLSVVDADVFTVQGQERKLTARLTATMTAVAAPGA